MDDNYSQMENIIDEENLIRLVHAKPCLYDVEDVHYRNNKLKEEAWIAVADEMGVNVDVTTLKDCWKKLRNCHRDALRRKKHQNEEKKSVKKWKHEDRMAFLLEFMAGCKEFPSSSASTRKEGTTSTIKSEPEEQFYLELSDLSTSPIPYKRSKTFEGVATTEPSAEIYPLGQENRPIPKWELSADKDEVDSFFESMCLTTKKLPKKYQLRIKKKLFDAVNEAEEEAANEDLLSVRVVNVGSEYR